VPDWRGVRGGVRLGAATGRPRWRIVREESSPARKLLFTSASTLAHTSLRHGWVDIPMGTAKLHTWIEYPAGEAKAPLSY
jgi:hypothetical protein